MRGDVDLTQLLLLATLAVAVAAMVFAGLAYGAARRDPMPALTREEAALLLRAEGDAIRDASRNDTAALRQEVGATLGQHHVAVTDRIATASDHLRDSVETRLDSTVEAQSKAARDTREELNASFQRLRVGVSDDLGRMGEQQRERLAATQEQMRALSETSKVAGEQLRATVEGRLDVLRRENAEKLDAVRQTVDEKLNDTLNKRLDESFGRVIEQLNRAYEVFGEMKTISSHVGDLKNVLTNPKLRGTFGEVQLAMLVQDFLSPSQYIKDAQMRDHTGERVEFAIRLPSADGEEVLLPVDAKFPREDHEHMIAAHEAGDMAAADHHRKQLENRIKLFAKDISRKYINPPRTTERAILFLPTESLFAEVLRQPGLFDYVQRECNVMLAGPTTFAAILHAFQVNHRSMAIAQRSGEIWETLSAVKTEFRKYNDVMTKIGNQLKTVSGSVETIGTRTRAMDRALRKVETMPDASNAAALLGLGAEDLAAAELEDLDDSPEPLRAAE